MSNSIDTRRLAERFPDAIPCRLPLGATGGYQRIVDAVGQLLTAMPQDGIVDRGIAKQLVATVNEHDALCEVIEAQAQEIERLKAGVCKCASLWQAVESGIPEGVCKECTWTHSSYCLNCRYWGAQARDEAAKYQALSTRLTEKTIKQAERIAKLERGLQAVLENELDE